MLYMLLICYDPNVPPDPSEPASLQPEHAALERELRTEGVYVSAAALMPPKVTPVVRVQRGGTLVTDGPFPETKEMLGGYYIIECHDAEQATAFARRVPVGKHGWIDVRPIALWHPDVERIAALARGDHA